MTVLMCCSGDACSWYRKRKQQQKYIITVIVIVIVITIIVVALCQNRFSNASVTCEDFLNNVRLSLHMAQNVILIHYIFLVFSFLV